MKAPYDFKTALTHRGHLVSLYRRLKRQFEDDGSWSWWLKQQIEEIDQELAEAHEAINGKMTTVGSSGHPVLQLDNIITPIVSQWQGSVQSQ